MRNIAFITNQIKDCAPIDIIAQIINYIKGNGYNPLVISLRPQDVNTKPDYFPNVKCISLNKKFIELELYRKKISNEVLEILVENGVDIVHSHSYQADIICSFLPKSIKKITTQHNIAEEDFYYGKGYFLGKWMTFNLMNRLSYFDCIVGVSNCVSNYCSNKLKNKNISIKTIYNNIHLPYNYNRNKKDKSLRFVFCGSLTKRKDPLLLLNAFTQLLDENLIPKDCMLEVLGDGCLRESVESIASKYPNNIFVRGFVENPIEIISTCDIYVSCSLSEGFGLSLIESLSLGLISICTNIPAFNEIVGDYPIVKELKFQKGDIKSLKKSIEKSINIDPTLMKDLENNIRKKFVDGQMSVKYLDLYKNI